MPHEEVAAIIRSIYEGIVSDRKKPEAGKPPVKAEPGKRKAFDPYWGLPLALALMIICTVVVRYAHWSIALHVVFSVLVWACCVAGIVLCFKREPVLSWVWGMVLLTTVVTCMSWPIAPYVLVIRYR